MSSGNSYLCLGVELKVVSQIGKYSQHEQLLGEKHLKLLIV